MKFKAWLVVIAVAFVFVLSDGSLIQSTNAEDADMPSEDAESQTDDDSAATLLWNYLMQNPGSATIIQNMSMDIELVGWLLHTRTEQVNESFTEALARKAGLPTTGTFPENSVDHEMIERLANLSKEELSEIQRLIAFIKQAVAHEQKKGTETSETSSTDTDEKAKTSGEISALLNAFKVHGLITEPSVDVSEAAPEPVETQGPESTPAPLSEAEIADLSHYLSSRFALYDNEQRQELSAWLLQLSPEQRNAVLNDLATAFEPEEWVAFMNWFRQAYLSCTDLQNTGTDSLQLPGRRTWADLTFPGFPPPAQGALTSVTETTAENGKKARQTVLTNVRQETFNTWREQITDGEGQSVVKHSAEFGDDLYRNIGSSLMPGKDKVLSLAQTNSEPAVDYYQVAEGPDIELAYSEGNLVITMLLP